MRYGSCKGVIRDHMRGCAYSPLLWASFYHRGFGRTIGFSTRARRQCATFGPCDTVAQLLVAHRKLTLFPVNRNDGWSSSCVSTRSSSLRKEGSWAREVPARDAPRRSSRAERRLHPQSSSACLFLCSRVGRGGFAGGKRRERKGRASERKVASAASSPVTNSLHPFLLPPPPNHIFRCAFFAILLPTSSFSSSISSGWAPRCHGGRPISLRSSSLGSAFSRCALPFPAACPRRCRTSVDTTSSSAASPGRPARGTIDSCLSRATLRRRDRSGWRRCSDRLRGDTDPVASLCGRSGRKCSEGGGGRECRGGMWVG